MFYLFSLDIRYIGTGTTNPSNSFQVSTSKLKSKLDKLKSKIDKVN